MNDLVKLPTNTGNYVFIEQMKLIGNVWRAAHKETQASYMVKILSRDAIQQPKTKTMFASEISLLKRLDHPLVAKFYEVLEDDKFYYLIFDLPQKDTLFAYMSKSGNEKYSDSKAKEFLLKLIDFFEYFQKQEFKNSRIVITPDTIYVSEEGDIIQIYPSIDGSNLICSKPETVVSFNAPEHVNGQQSFTPAFTPSFTWICGIFLYYIKTGKLPFSGDNVEEIERSILMSNLTFPEENPLSNEIIQLIKKLLTKNPVTRVPLTTIANLPVMRGNAPRIPTGLGVAKGSLRNDDRGKSKKSQSDQQNPNNQKKERMQLERVGSNSHLLVGRVRLTPRKQFLSVGKQHSLKQVAPPLPH